MLEQQQILFHIEEFKALRAEIDQRIASMRTLEREAVLGAFAIYAWLATQSSIESFYLPLAASWLPVLLAIVTNMRREAERQQIDRLGLYIRMIEEEFASARIQGWERQSRVVGLPSDK
jgi:hypothetical protein